MKILSVVGARPNLIKIASISKAIEKYNQECEDSASKEIIEQCIVHTNQHYDTQMSECFFEELKIPAPDINLNVGSGSHAQQTARIIERFEPVLLEEMPDVLLVVGDVNSTIACTLVASKIQYPSGHSICRPLIVHVEAGLRSFDRTMPEEINRVLTDSISDLFFVTEENAITNLKREGIDSGNIFFVGNVMIDTLLYYVNQINNSKRKKNIEVENTYGIVTIHRPSNVDDPELLLELVKCLNNVAGKIQLILPLHPRTRGNLIKFNLLKELDNEKIKIVDPLGYLDFLHLIKDATLILTDSGGIQEETTALGIPCITLRENTERPITVTQGSNYLVGLSPEKILNTVNMILSGKGKKSKVPQLWDGKAGERIIAEIVGWFKNSAKC